MNRFLSRSHVILCASAGLAIGVMALVFADQLPTITPAPRKTERPIATAPRAAATAEASRAADRWQVLLVGGRRIGSVRQSSQYESTDTGPVIQTAQQLQMKIKRFGQELSMDATQRTRETADGDLRSFSYELANSPTGRIEVSGSVENDHMRLETTVAGTTRSSRVGWQPQTKSPIYQERLLESGQIAEGETRKLRVYFPDRQETADVLIDAGPTETVTLPDGTTRQLRKFTVTDSGTAGSTSVVHVDPKDGIVLVATDLFGQPFQAVTVPEQEAVKQLAGEELDLAVSTLIPVTELPDAGSTRSVTYRVHVPGENVAALFISDETQTVRVIDHETVEITVAAPQLKQVREKVGQQSPTGEPRYTQASQMLQSNDAGVRRHASRAVTPGQPPAEAAAAMERYVHQNLTTKNFSTAFATAAETARDLEGDCTEHAVLLAAMLRSRGIPSRVAAGLVYIPQVAQMGGHLWTEAHIGGKWIPLDATMGNGGTGADRLKVGTSALEDSGPVPVMAFAPMIKLGTGTKIEITDVQR